MEELLWGKIKTELKKRGWTQAQFAEICKIRFATLHGWIAKHRMPDAISLLRMANALDTTIEELLDYKKIPDIPEVIKVKHSSETRSIVKMLLPLNESQIQRVGFGVASAIGSLGFNDIDDHSANAG